MGRAPWAVWDTRACGGWDTHAAVGTHTLAVLHSVSLFVQPASENPRQRDRYFLQAVGQISLDILEPAAIMRSMATPRRLLVDPDRACDYHIVSRCVRRAWLCGFDHVTGRDYSHRKRWLESRLAQLVPCFAVAVHAYSIMSNHFHLVVRYDPKAHERWSDEEVARRWVDAFPPPTGDGPIEQAKAEKRELLLGDPTRLARARKTLGSLSAFMKHLKQPIARRANLEDECEGHFFEQRFYSGALLSEQALVAAMAYVDLNPVRAELVREVEACENTSLTMRTQQNTAEALAEYLAPVMTGLEDDPESHSASPMALGDYLDMVRGMAAEIAAPAAAHRPAGLARQLANFAVLRRRQRAYGPLSRLREWARARGFQVREAPLPG